MRKCVLQFLRDETGATAIEYALVAGGIAIVIVAAVDNTGTSVNNSFSAVLAGL